MLRGYPCLLRTISTSTKHRPVCSGCILANYNAGGRRRKGKRYHSNTTAPPTTPPNPRAGDIGRRIEDDYAAIRQNYSMFPVHLPLTFSPPIQSIYILHPIKHTTVCRVKSNSNPSPINSIPYSTTHQAQNRYIFYI